MNTFSRIHQKSWLALAFALSISACSLPNAPATKAAATMSKPYSSGEILQVLETVNEAEIKQANLALQRSNTASVKEVAQMIIKDHTQSSQRIASLSQSIGAKLEGSVLNTGLRTQGNKIAENLTSLSGREFDCTFLQKQAEQHALVLKTVREQLLPGAEQAQVKEVLTAAAPKLEAHLEAARTHHARLQCPDKV